MAFGYTKGRFNHTIMRIGKIERHL